MGKRQIEKLMKEVRRMPEKKPDFMKSPYFVDKPGNWHLKPGAPKELQEEFDQYMQEMEQPGGPGAVEANRIPYPYFNNGD